MKTILRSIATFFAMLMLCVSFPAFSVVNTTSNVGDSEFNKNVYQLNDYVVKKGDTLSALGLKTDESYASIAKRNSIKNPHMIYVGQVISLKRSTSDVLASVAGVKQDLDVMTRELGQMHQDLGEIKSTLLAANTSLAASSKKLDHTEAKLLSALIGLVGFSALFIAIIYSQSKKIKQQHREIFAQKRQIKSYEEKYPATKHLLDAYEQEVSTLKQTLKTYETKFVAMKQLLKDCDGNGSVDGIGDSPEEHKISPNVDTTSTPTATQEEKPTSGERVIPLARRGKQMRHC